jgi:S1-C subfamily serine protease
MGAQRRVHATWSLTLLLLGINGWSIANHDAEQQAVDTAWAVSIGRAAAIERATPAVVAIDARCPERREQGSGVIVGESGLVLTAYHVVDGVDTIRVRTADGAEYEATIRAIDEPSDLALLALRAEGRRFPTVRLAVSAGARVGESVVALASPYGLVRTASSGILSAKGRTQVVADNVVPLLQTDAPIHPGSSGGALINLRGELVGMINAILTRSGRDEGIGFAVPSDEIRRVLPILLAGGTVERPWIGVRAQTIRGIEGAVQVDAVIPGGPAAEAGLLPFDRILRIAGRRIESVPEMRGVLRDLPVGMRTTVEFVRGTLGQTAEITIGKKDKNRTDG